MRERIARRVGASVIGLCALLAVSNASPFQLIGDGDGDDPVRISAARPCAGDCNTDGRVSIDELLSGIAIALGGVAEPACATAFCRADCGPGPARAHVEVTCLVRAVGNALDGCAADACRDDADCDDGNGCTIDHCSDDGCMNDCLCV